MLKRKKNFTFADKASYIKMYIRLMEAITPGDVLTPREIDVLATYLSFDGEVAEMARFSRSFRKEALRILGMSQAQMTNIITSLKDKDVLKEGADGELFIDPLFIPEKDGVEINLTLNGFKG